MKKLCRNCGAKVPKKAEICPKCGEPYEYIDLVRLDPEEEKLIQVDKPSIMPNVCTLILSTLAFCYALTLLYFQFSEQNSISGEKAPEISVTDETSLSEESSEPEVASVYYNAIDFIGKPFSEVTKVLGDRYSIKLSETASAEFTDFPVTVTTLDKQMDDSFVTKVVVTGNAQISPVASADMTFENLKIVLDLKENAPELNEQDAFYYAHTVFDNGICQISADFKFDNEATDKAPIEVILTDISLNAPKKMGTVNGIDDFLNIRSGASYEAETIHELVNGDQVEILDTVTDDEDQEWFKIRYNDIEGYVSATYVVRNEDIKNLSNSSSKPEESSEAEDENDEETDEETDDEEDEEDY